MSAPSHPPRLQLPSAFAGLPVVASVSGGKDSTALVLALQAANIPFRAVFADTGWEAPETYAYLDYLRQTVCPIDVVGVEGGMRAKIRARAGFPGRLQRWCTSELKVKPLREYHDAIGTDTVSAVGVRADESKARSQMPETEDDPEWGGWIWRPLLHWTVQDVLLAHRAAGVKVNPLYQRGHERVGCYPCIYSNKEEIRLIAKHSPERIDDIALLEQEASEERARRNAERPGRYSYPQATFFQTRIPGKIMSIHDVAAWSKTTRGGRHLPLLPPPPTGGCMRWGLCEPQPAEEHDETPEKKP